MPNKEKPNHKASETTEASLTMSLINEIVGTVQTAINKNSMTNPSISEASIRLNLKFALCICAIIITKMPLYVRTFN